MMHPLNTQYSIDTTIPRSTNKTTKKNPPNRIEFYELNAISVDQFT